MNYPSIRIEGAILSPDVLERIEDLPGQRPADFGLDATAKVKDEIARAWADAQDYWRIFQRKLETLKADSPATTETRQQWIVPLLGLLGYQLEYQARGAELNGKTYNISHRATNRGQAPVQIVGYSEPAGLDRKPTNATLRMSAHAVVQEFINLNEELYGIVTNGRVLRLLRDSSRLIKLSYLEFDLDRIFTDGLFADFAIMYRLLHATRLPVTNDTATESLIERYHQDSLDSGARIREGLSSAVEMAIRDFGNGFLSHQANDLLRTAVADGSLTPEAFYKNLLRLIYRLLFLMVIEERDLVFPQETTTAQREVYRNYYSVQRLRLLSEKRYLADRRRHDLWLALTSTFRLFEASGPGEKLGIYPLAGDLFGREAIGQLAVCTVGNDVLLGCLRSLSLYEHPDTHQPIRVNYGALNVEEFGSVYEGLLEYEPVFTTNGGHIEFAFRQGGERAATGSHYTPDELVQPLIKHSLDYLIADKLKTPNPEQELLSLRVADIACGSGHILLAAARRIATELAIVRTGEEQPSPSAYREALRDVIRTCIFGVDLNPLAVELCKVAFWLEAHIPGKPLNFLDHHIKCGNSIVGYVRQEDVERGVPDEAFTAMPGDDKDVGSELRKRNKKERAAVGQAKLEFSPDLKKQLEEALLQWRQLSSLPERTPEEIRHKKSRFATFDASWLLKQICAIPIAQFYLPKTDENLHKVMTDADFRPYWRGAKSPRGQDTAEAWALSEEKRFFHWFLEFPEILAQGGFDCIVGNPPYLGAQKVSQLYGRRFFEYLSSEFKGGGLADLVAYFVRRAFDLVREGGFVALLATSALSKGDSRVVGLAPVTARDGVIIYAVRRLRWPGQSATHVAMFVIKKGRFEGTRLLDGRPATVISSYFNDDPIGEATMSPLRANGGKSFIGSNFNGDGFIVEQSFVTLCTDTDPSYRDVLFRNLLGANINAHPAITNSRWIICFFDWDKERAEQYPICFSRVERLVKPHRQNNSSAVLRKRWWQYERLRKPLYDAIHGAERVLVRSQAGKHNVFEFVSNHFIFDQKVVVFALCTFVDYALLNSSIHEVFVWRFSGDLGGTTVNYSPERVFETFPQCPGSSALEGLGNAYHRLRRSTMLSLWLGLTDIYNLFHARDLSPAKVAKVSKKPEDEAERGYEGLLELRRLHVELDTAVRDAYGWQDLDLGHDFHEVETLPENDRTRYTISPTARKEVLRRLLELNHTRAAEEAAAMPTKPKRAKKKITDGETMQADLFSEAR